MQAFEEHLLKGVRLPENGFLREIKRFLFQIEFLFAAGLEQEAIDRVFNFLPGLLDCGQIVEE